MKLAGSFRYWWVREYAWQDDRLVVVDKNAEPSTNAWLHGAHAAFMWLADTPPTPAGILEFVNKYGALTRDFGAMSRVEYVEQIVAIQQVITLWHFRNDMANLGKHFRWERGEKDCAVYYLDGPDLPQFTRGYGSPVHMEYAMPPVISEFMAIWGARAPLYLAEHYVASLFEKELLRNPGVLLSWRPIELTIKASDLRQAAWFQLMTLVSNQSGRLARCIECNQWMLSRTGPGITRKYCDSPCRARAARKRKQAADQAS